MDAGDLVQLEQVKRCKYRYLRALDQKDWTTLADTLTDDVQARYSGGAHSFDGRRTVVAFLEQNLGGHDMLTSHRVHHPEIDLVGDGQATATWAMDDVVVMETLGLVLSGAGFYDDVCVRCDDGVWRLAETGYKRTYEQLVPVDSMRGRQLTASWWGTDGRSTLA